MPDDTNVIPFPAPATITTNGAAPVATLFPPRQARDLDIDAEDVVRSVREWVTHEQMNEDRGHWLKDRLNRYAKFRGYRAGTKTWPWSHASDVHLPILQAAEARSHAGIENTIASMRPLFRAFATRFDHVAKERKITDLIDAQMFVDVDPAWIGDFLANFLQDGNAVAYTPWVRERRRLQSRHFRPAPQPDDAPAAYLLATLAGQRGDPALFRDLVDLIPDTATRWRVAYRDETGHAQEATVEPRQDGATGAVELVIERDVMAHDGPVPQVVPVDAILVPIRCANLQPCAAWNPDGAGRVVLHLRLALGEIKRRMATGEFNWLDDAGLEKIVAKLRLTPGLLARPDDRREALRTQKDQIEGRESAPAPPTVDAALDARMVDVWMVFDQWTIDEARPAEDTFWMIAADAEVLCEGRRLTERWPTSGRPWRPLAEAVCLRVPHRWYGISLLELGESLHDLVKSTFDMSFDSGTLSNLPFGYYSSSIPLQAEILSVAPGTMNPVPGDPRAAIYYPTLPTRDQSWAFNVLGFALNLFQQTMGQGAIQQGQVPAGRSSALRTFGTTFALIQQGDVRADQLLLHVLQGLSQVAHNCHRMNRVLLPPGKEIRVVGWDGAREQGYVKIEALDEIDADVEFEFRPDFLNSNPMVLSQMLQSALAVVVQPLLMQSGITNLQQIYELVRDYLRALRLDPKKYVQPPQGQLGRPILAQEAIAMLMAGDDPSGIPLEGAQRHLDALTEFVNADEFGMLPPARVEALKRWLVAVSQMASQERTIAAAQQFQNALNQQGGGGGVPTTIQEPSAADAVGGAASQGQTVTTGAM